MSDYKVSGSDLSAIADAIRTKGQTSASLSFPNGFVNAIDAISTGGGGDEPTLITKNITANGTYNASADNADGYSSVNVQIPSRIITGTFTGAASDEGSAIDISIPYTGNGYPVAGIFYPSHGTFKMDDPFAVLVQRYAEAMMAFVKNNVDVAPTYNDNTAEANLASVLAFYKYSTSDATNYTSNGQKSVAVFRSAKASDAWGSCIRIHSSTAMSAYIASTSYGFASGIEYAYALLYSS